MQLPRVNHGSDTVSFSSTSSASLIADDSTKDVFFSAWVWFAVAGVIVPDKVYQIQKDNDQVSLST